MIWRPIRWPSALIGIAIIVLILALDVALLLVLSSLSPSLSTFFVGLVVAMSVPLLIAVAYRVYALLTLRYELDRNALIVVWGATRQVVPLDHVRQVVRSRGLARLAGWHWPGDFVGRGHIDGLGPTHFYATDAPTPMLRWGVLVGVGASERPLGKQIVLVTAQAAYALSPAEPAKFLADLELHRRLGPIHSLDEVAIPTGVASWPLWSDRLAWLLISLGVMASAALFAYAAWRYPDLPPLLALHFDLSGEADRIGGRAEVFRLPLIGLIILGTNIGLGAMLHRRERFLGYLLFAGAILAQILMGVALHNI